MALYLGTEKYAGAAIVNTEVLGSIASGSAWVTATSSSSPSSDVCAAYQILGISGVTANSKIIAGLAENCTKEQRTAATDAELFVYSTAKNQVTLCCSDASFVPTIDIPISVWVITM